MSENVPNEPLNSAGPEDRSTEAPGSAAGETVQTGVPVRAEDTEPVPSFGNKRPLRDEDQADDSHMSFADKLYKEITAVIGGDNPNQFFCMGLPGTMLEPNQYSYAVEQNEPKPALVEANESKLVDKLFDACTLASADNGRHLHTQYKTALDMLSPKFNGKLFEAKTKLRKVLMTPYPYIFDDGTPSTGLTLQQVFYKLYGDYVKAKQEWAKMQLEEKRRLQNKYRGGTVEDNRSIQNEYLDWYETEAEPQLLLVQEKLDKVLNVFSLGDMEVITGILSSGAGREVAEAQEALSNVEKRNPDGGTIYPVTLYPENWFKLLDSSFTPIDLLESPAALSQKMSVLTAQQASLTTQVNTLLSVIPDDQTVSELRNAYTDAETKYKSAMDKLTETYTNVTVDMLKTFVSVLDSTSDKKAENVPQSAVARIFGIDVGQVSELLTKLGESANDCLSAQSSLNQAAEAASTAAMTYFESKNLQQYKSMLLPLQAQLDSVKAEISQLQQQIALSTSVQGGDPGSVAPNQVPDGFTQLLITSKFSQVNQQSSSSASASNSSYGVSFFFGGYSSSQSHQEAVSQALSSQTDMEIQIGMSVAKVTIGREWFNPGVFLLSGDMYNTSSLRIAPNKEYSGFTDERLNEMNQCVFPCYPTAFVIARDVTIRFSSATAMSDSFAQSVEDHSSRGGGFFIFGGSSSSSSSSSQSNSTATSNSNSVTVRFTTPQILGYYLEATAADKSAIISDNTQVDSDFISIFDFIQDFQKMLDDYNSTYHKQTLSL